jgi:hypothetical protein
MEYKIGFSIDEFEKIKNLLYKHGFEYKKVIVGEILKETIPFCLNAVYKNPSSMRFDAPNAFSCSSLISYLYTQAGVWMPSLSIDKYVFGTPITKEELKFGDLVFSNTGIGKIRFETVEYLPGTKVPEGVDHVGMYMGDGNILHASSSTGKVHIEKVEESEMFKNIVGYRRMADIEEERYVVKVNEKISKEDFIKNL